MLRTFVLALMVAVSPTVAGAQSFGSIFTELPADFGRLAAPSNLIVLGAAGAGSLLVHPEDDAIVARADRDGFYGPGNVLGDGATHAAAGLAIFIGGHLAHNSRTALVGADLLRAQIVSGAITNAIKYSANRTRPDGGRRSFPSGHASSTFAAAAVLQGYFGWKAAVPSYLVATYVAAARVETRHHFASDVLFGAGIGIASGRAVTFGRANRRVTIAPAVTWNSAGFTLSIN
jgi:membrane-associated phospholipid phosphatase